MRVRLAGLAIGAAALFLITWFVLASRAEAPRPELSTAGAEEEAEATVALHRSPGAERPREVHRGRETEGAPDPGGPIADLALRVVIGVDRDGKELADQPLEVQCEYLGSLRLIDLQTRTGPLDRSTFDADVEVTGLSGTMIRVPVSKPGAYRVRARITGSDTWHGWDQNTLQDVVRESIHLVSRLRVRIASPGPEAIRSVSANLREIGEPEVFALGLGNGVFEFEDPAILPVEVGVQLIGYDVVFHTMVRENDAVISFAGIVPKTLKIEDAWSGVPVVDARVAVRFAQTRVTVRSATDGIVRVPYPKDPLELMRRFFPYSVVVDADGYARARIGDLNLLHRASHGLPTMRLLKENCPGGVLLSETGAPARGTRVYLISAFSTVAFGVCDEEGRFALRAGAIGPNLGVLDRPCKNAMSGVAAAGVFLYLVDATGAEGLLGPLDWVSLAKGEWIGRMSPCSSWVVDVRRATDDEPVAGATIRRIPLAGGQPVFWLAKDIPPVRTDSRGRCSFGRSLGGRWRLDVGASGYANTTFDVDPAETPTSILRLRSGGKITLEVVDRFGEPIPGVRVTLRARGTSDVSNTSDERGRMAFRVDPSKRYLWFVANSDLKPDMTAPLQLEAGKGDYTIRLVGREEVVVNLGSRNGEPIDEGVLLIRSPKDRRRIRVAPRTPFMKTVELPRERVEVRALAPGFNGTDWTTVDVGELERPFAMSFVLPDGFTVRGSLASTPMRTGDRVVISLEPDRIVGFEGVGGRPHTYETRMFKMTAVPDGGAFSFPRVSAGRYRLKVVVNGHVERARDILVTGNLDLGTLTE